LKGEILRPIVWGFILTVVGGILWVMFSFVGAIGELATGEKDVLMLALVYLFGILFFFSFPVAIVIEVVNWVRRRRAARVQAVVEAEAKGVAMPSILSVAKPRYCMECVVELNPLGETGKMMCPKCGRIYG
jgi:Na+/melibiose symporter-like transporter